MVMVPRKKTLKLIRMATLSSTWDYSLLCHLLGAGLISFGSSGRYDEKEIFAVPVVSQFIISYATSVKDDKTYICN